MSALIAILLGLVVLYVALKLALGLVGVAVAAVVVIMAYLIAQKVTVRGR